MSLASLRRLPIVVGQVGLGRIFTGCTRCDGWDFGGVDLARSLLTSFWMKSWISRSAVQPFSPKVVSSINLEFRPKAVICRLAPGWTDFFSFLVLSCSVKAILHTSHWWIHFVSFTVLYISVFGPLVAVWCCLYFARIFQGPSILVRLLGCIYIFPILNRSKTVFTAFEWAQ